MLSVCGEVRGGTRGLRSETLRRGEVESVLLSRVEMPPCERHGSTVLRLLEIIPVWTRQAILSILSLVYEKEVSSH